VKNVKYEYERENHKGVEFTIILPLDFSKKTKINKSNDN